MFWLTWCGLVWMLRAVCYALCGGVVDCLCWFGDYGVVIGVVVCFLLVSVDVVRLMLVVGYCYSI